MTASHREAANGRAHEAPAAKSSLDAYYNKFKHLGDSDEDGETDHPFAPGSYPPFETLPPDIVNDTYRHFTGLAPEMMPGLGVSGDAISSEGESMQEADLEGDSSDDEEQCWCTRCTHYTLTTHRKARHDRIQNLSEAQFQAAAEAARNQELSRRAAKTGAKPATGFQPGFFKPQPEKPGEASGKAAPGSSAQAESDEDMPELIVTDDSEAESGSARRKPAVKPAAKQKAKPEAKPPAKPEANGGLKSYPLEDKRAGTKAAAGKASAAAAPPASSSSSQPAWFKAAKQVAASGQLPSAAPTSGQAAAASGKPPAAGAKSQAAAHKAAQEADDDSDDMPALIGRGTDSDDEAPSTAAKPAQSRAKKKQAAASASAKPTTNETASTQAKQPPAKPSAAKAQPAKSGITKPAAAVGKPPAASAPKRAAAASEEDPFADMPPLVSDGSDSDDEPAPPVKASSSKAAAKQPAKPAATAKAAAGSGKAAASSGTAASSSSKAAAGKPAAKPSLQVDSDDDQMPALIEANFSDEEDEMLLGMELDPPRDPNYTSRGKGSVSSAGFKSGFLSEQNKRKAEPGKAGPGKVDASKVEASSAQPGNKSYHETLTGRKPAVEKVKSAAPRVATPEASDSEPDDDSDDDSSDEFEMHEHLSPDQEFESKAAARRARRAEEEASLERHRQKLAQEREKRAQEAALAAKALLEAEAREERDRIEREAAKNDRRRQKKERQKAKKKAKKGPSAQSATSAAELDDDSEDEPVVLPPISAVRSAASSAASSSPAGPSTSAAAGADVKGKGPASPEQDRGKKDAKAAKKEAKAQARAAAMADNVFAVLGKGKVKDRGQGPLSKKEQRKVAAARQAALNFVEAAASSSAAAPEAADPGTPGRERLNEAVGTPRSTRSDDNDDAEFATHFASLSGRSRAPATVQTPAHAVQSHRPAVQLTTLAVQPRASPGRSPARASSPDAQPQASARSIPVGRASSPQPPAASAQMPRWQASHLPEQPPAAAAQLRPQPARPAPAMGLHTSSTPFTGRISAQHRELQSAANSTDEQRLSAAIAAASDFVEGRANVHRHDEVAALRTLLRDARLRLRSLREAPLPTISPTLPPQPVVRPGMGQPPPGMSHPLMNQPHVSQQQQQGPPRPVWPPFMQASPANTPPPLYQGPPRPPQVGPVGQVGPRPPPPAFPLPNRPRPPAYLAGAQGMPRPPMPYPRPPAPYHTPPPPSYNPSANTSNLPIHRPGPPRPLVSPPRPPAARLPQTLNPTTYPTAGSGGGDSYLDDEDDENCCVVCMEMPKQMLFVPCGHMVCCQTCSGKIAAQQPALCPFCRTHILDTVLPE